MNKVSEFIRRVREDLEPDECLIGIIEFEYDPRWDELSVGGTPVRMVKAEEPPIWISWPDGWWEESHPSYQEWREEIVPRVIKYLMG